MNQPNGANNDAYRAGMLKAAAVMMRELSQMGQSTSVLEAIFQLDAVLQDDLGLRRSEIIEAMRPDATNQPEPTPKKPVEACVMCNLTVPEPNKYNGVGCAGMCM